MRVAFFLEVFPKLSETFILNQITGLIDRGHSADIFAFARNHDEMVHETVKKYDLISKTHFFDSVPRSYAAFSLFALDKMARDIGWLPYRMLKAATIAVKSRFKSVRTRTLRELMQLPKNSNYDIIHCQFGTIGAVVLNMINAGAISGKLVVSFRGYDATIAIRNDPNIYERLFDEGDLFLPVSDSLKNHIIKAGCKPNKIHIHHSGINCKELQFSGPSKVDDGPFRIITVARLVEKKGISYAVESIARIKEQGYLVKYTIVGDGELRSDLQQLVNRLGLAQEVEVIGWRRHDQVVKLMKDSHLLISPSIEVNGDQEGIPNSLKEAMAMGLPVIGTNHGGIPELIDEAESGFIIPEKDIVALAEKIIVLIENPQLWHNLGRNGANKIRREFDMEKLNDELIDLYSSLWKL